MAETCDYCGETFDEKQALHLHWGEQHEDELTSHQEETYRKTQKERQKTQKSIRQQRRQKIRKYGGYMIFVALFLGIGGFILAQVQVNADNGGEEASFDLSSQPSLGPENASVTVVSFADYQCSHCKTFEEQVVPRLVDDYVESGDVQFYALHYAALGKSSVTAAIGAECVYQESPDAFWTYHKKMFANQRDLRDGKDSLVKNIASNVVSSNKSVQRCIENKETRSQVTADVQQGQANGVQGTPTVFVNGHQLDSWGYQTISSAIDARLD